MEQQNTINPDAVCQQVLNAKMDVYRSKESFESVLKMYNDNVEGLLNLINLMKQRIVNLERELERSRTENRIVKEEKTADEIKS